MIEGVLFDMDGVIVDSERFICEAAVIMFRELGCSVKESDFVPFIGTGEDRYLGGVAEKYNISLNLPQAKARTYQLYGEVIRNKLQPLPGVFNFISKCRSLKLKMALATSADRIKVTQNLTEIHLPEGTFDGIVSGSDIIHKKPDPEIFITAAKKLGLSPVNCLVVEDAVSGIKAGRAAGAKCLGITGSFPADQLNADWHSPDLAAAPDSCLHW